MARIIHTRIASRSVLGKRRRSGATGPSKRRRFTRRRRKTSTITSKSGHGGAFGYRNRRTPRSVYRNRLWIATSAKPKYRSIMARTTTVTAPAGGVTQNNSIFNALKNAADALFWTSAGGRIGTEDTAAITFSDASIVLRGGMIKLTCNNENSVADPVVVRVWLYRTHTSQSGANWTGTQVTGFDPTMVLETQRDLGKLMMYRQFLLENNNLGEVSYRLPMMEINAITFNGGTQGYYWLVSVYAPAGNAANVQIVNSYNLSFVGDVL